MTRRPVLVTGLALLAAGSVAGWAASRNDNLGSPSDLLWIASFAGFALVGATILRHRPGHRLGMLFVAAGLGTPAAVMFEELGLLLDSPVLRVVSLATFGVTWMLATALVPLFYPDGALPSRRWLPVAVVQYLLMVLVCLAVAVDPQPFDIGTGRSPVAVDALGAWPQRVVAAALLASAVVTVAALASLVLRWRRAGGRTRGQLAWLAVGGLAVIVLIVLGWALDRTVPDLPPLVGTMLEALQLAVIPAVTYAAMLRHRLFDVETALRRSLVSVLLTGSVVISYALTLGLTAGVVGAELGVGASLVAGAVVAVLLVPVKTVLDGKVERMLFGERRRPHAALAVVGSDLSGVTSDQGVLPAAAESIRRALRLGFVAVRLEGGDEPAARAGEPGEVSARAPMVAFGRCEGELLVGVDGPGDRLRPRDLVLLGQLAHQLALLARSVRLAQSLQASREQLVAAREDERRRLRRDLHDGVGPVLAGLTLQVDALRAHLDPVSTTGPPLAAAVKTELRRAIEALRQAVEGLRPADLDQLGLAEVLAEHARSLTAGSLLDARVVCPDDLQVSAATEVAAYRILTEAMTNVVRHAAAQHMRVTVVRETGRLLLSVEDDGVGVRAGHREGIGLLSMRERAEELGGTCTVTAGPRGGTLVTADLPVGDPA